MNTGKKLGFIEDHGGLKVSHSLLTGSVHDERVPRSRHPTALNHRSHRHR